MSGRELDSGLLIGDTGDVGSQSVSEGRVHPDKARRHRLNPFLVTVLLVLSYLLIALYANWPSWPGNPSLYRPGDLTGSAWDFAWTAHVVLHPQNPFFTTYINYPQGENIAQSSPAWLLGILTLPLTVLFGPLSSLNFWLWLSYPLSASAAFYVLRRFGVSQTSSYLCGLLYGFSPYMSGQGLDHLPLVFIPLPPLIFLTGYRLLTSERGARKREGLLLGLLVAAQYFIGQEVAVSTVLFLAIGFAVLAVSHPGSVPRVLADTLPSLAIGIVVAAALVAYPIWMAVKGPQHYIGSVGSGLSADLLGSVIPTSLERFVPNVIAQYGDRLVQGDVPENGSYLSIPIILAAVFFFVRYRRDRWVRFTGVMTLVTVVLSWGAYLMVAGVPTSIPGPAWLLWKAPGLSDMAEVRFSGYTFFFLGALLARGIDNSLPRGIGNVRTPVRRYRCGIANGSLRARKLCIERVGPMLLIVAGLIMLIPRWPDQPVGANVPPYFQSSAVRAIPAGGTVLISPYPSVAEVAPMLWQADSNFRFRIIGGYVLVPGLDGRVSDYPEQLQPQEVGSYLWQLATNGTPPSGSPGVHVIVRELRTWLRNYRVSAVISSGDASNVSALNALFSQALGPPSFVGGGVDAWYQVPRLVR